MSGEGGATGESLLAIGIRAFVWTLARMDTTMSSKRARVAEWLLYLVSENFVSSKLTWIETYLSATLTHVGLLACMYTLMNSQSRSLNELLSTAWMVTSMWSNSAVDTLCEVSDYSSRRRR